MNLALQTGRSCFQRLESYLNQFFNRLSANDEELCRVNQIKIIKWLKWEGRDMEKSMRDINESIKEGTGELERILERWRSRAFGICKERKSYDYYLQRGRYERDIRAACKI